MIYDAPLTRRSIFALVAASLLLPTASYSQTRQQHLIGMLAGGPEKSPFAQAGRIAFRERLRELGYTDENLIIESRFAEGRVERLPALVGELVRLGPEVIVTAGTAATKAAKQATNTIPIVMAISADPVGSGLVASYARPGGNVTPPGQPSPSRPSPFARLPRAQVEYLACTRTRVCGTRSGASAPRPRLSSVPLRPLAVWRAVSWQLQ